MTETTEQLVAEGVGHFGRAETDIARAVDQLIGVSSIYPDAYVNGDLAGGDALKARNRCIELAGKLSAIHSEIIELHEKSTKFAVAAGKDIAGPYQELPPLDGPSTRSLGR